MLNCKNIIMKPGKYIKGIHALYKKENMKYFSFVHGHNTTRTQTLDLQRFS